MKLKYCLLPVLFFTVLSCTDDRIRVTILNEINVPQVLHGIGKIELLATKGKIRMKAPDGDLIVSTALDPQLGPESFRIETEGKQVNLIGGDAIGLMYALLHVRDQLEAGKTDIPEAEESPRFTFRAVKFNLPWDSYRRGKALQLHAETCRDTLFWEAFLDMMTENRFNKLTLWNLHPFNYLVKTEKYPEACGFSDEEMAGWEAFWTSLFRMAKERGIEPYLVNWNIFVSPEFAKAHGVAEYCIEGKYFVDKGDTSEIIRDYTREVVRETIDRYPDLSGLGITLGEGMGGMTADEREEWLLESFVGGMRQASRKISFIHRVPLSAGTGSEGSTSHYVEKMTRQTLDTLSCVESPINIELKFNWSHGHSCTELVKVHGGELSDSYWNPPPEKYRLAWMMRNEDFFVLRWGQPGFIREHVAENGHPWVNGYFVGSECYIPAKDYITALPGASYRYAFERQWMFYKNWGRLLYDPNTPDEVFREAFETRFPGKGETLFEAQTKVSRIPLIIASYWNATWDNTLYSEGLLSIMGRDSVKLISLPDMCDKQPMDPDYLSIQEYLAGDKAASPRKISPVELADSIETFCSSALEEVSGIRTGDHTDLLYEVSDIRTWAHLGLYFAGKLRAAVAYQQYLDSGEQTFLVGAVSWLEEATRHWKKVSEITSEVYDPMPMQHYERNGDVPFHWSTVEKEVIAELEWLKGQVKS